MKKMLFGKDGLGDCLHSWSVNCTFMREFYMWYGGKGTLSVDGDRPLANGDTVTMTMEKNGTRNKIIVLCDAFLGRTLSFETHTHDIERIKVGVSIYVKRTTGRETNLRLIDYIHRRMTTE